MSSIIRRAFLDSKIFAFLKYWKMNVTEEINIGGHKFKTTDLFSFLKEVILAYESNTSGYSLRFGADELFSCANQGIFLRTINLIWRDPETYFIIDCDTQNKGYTHYNYFLSKLNVRITVSGQDIDINCEEYLRRNLEDIKIDS